MRFLVPILTGMVLLSSCGGSELSERFAPLVGRPYGEIHYALRDTLRRVYESDNDSVVRAVVTEMRHLPDKRGDRQWWLEAEFLDANFAHDYRGGDDDEFVARLKELKSIADHCGNRVFALRATRRLFDHYQGLDDHIYTIFYADRMDEMMDSLTLEEFPDIVDNHYALGSFFMNYRDFDRCRRCFRFVTDCDTVYDAIQRVYVHSRNALGLICRNFNDIDSSDYWFNSVFRFDEEHGIIEKRGEVLAFIEGNLGRNDYIREDYPAAVLKLERSLSVMADTADWSYSMLLCINLAEAYLELDRNDEARGYIRRANEYAQRLGMPEGSERLKLVEAKYYANVGDGRRVRQCLDAANELHRLNEAKWSAYQIRNVEVSLNREIQERNRTVISTLRRTVIAVASVAAVIVALLAVILTLLSRKKRALESLAMRNKEWALDFHRNVVAGTVPLSPSALMERKAEDRAPEKGAAGREARSAADELRQQEMERRLVNYFEETKCYLDADISLDKLAMALGTNRTYLSRCINGIAPNFNGFLNRYRIADAIHELSLNSRIKTEELCYNCGFNNRKSFYNAFRNITGMTFNEFREAMENRD